MKVAEIFEAASEHVLVSMVKRLLKSGAKVYLHPGDPKEMKKDPDAEIVVDIVLQPDYISIYYNDAASITYFDDADEAKLVKRKSRAKKPIWDLYVIS